MRLKDIKKAVVDSLKTLYPDIPVYGSDTTRGFKKPCFFVNLNTTTVDGNHQSILKGCFIEVIFNQATPNEADALEFFENMEKAFYPKLEVGERSLSTQDFDSDFVGNEENIPRVEFYTEFYKDVEKPEEKAQLLKTFRIKEEL